jgi:hypothetical protein
VAVLELRDPPASLWLCGWGAFRVSGLSLLRSSFFVAGVDLQRFKHSLRRVR